MEKNHLAHVEAKINEMRTSLPGLTDDKELDEFFKIIHNPGFTSIAERTFLIGIVDSMHAHAKIFAGLKRVLLEGSRAVQAK